MKFGFLCACVCVGLKDINYACLDELFPLVARELHETVSINPSEKDH